MPKKNLILIVFYLCIALGQANNHHQLYPFTQKKQAQHFIQLLQSYRCMVCANETLYDSSTTFAKDVSDKIYAMMKKGKSDQAIDQMLTQRFGQSIRLNPPKNHDTFLLWWLPLLGLLGASALIWARRNS